jgi:hypothetical protein
VGARVAMSMPVFLACTQCAQPHICAPATVLAMMVIAWS